MNVTASRPVLRFFFEAGSGICLWAGNDVARDRYGYAIDHRDLELNSALADRLDRLIALFDTSLDWDDPGRGNIWTELQRREFAEAARSLLKDLNGEVAEFLTIVDEID